MWFVRKTLQTKIPVVEEQKKKKNTLMLVSNCVACGKKMEVH